MRNAPPHALAVMLLVAQLLSQANKPEPFGFKDDKLGMSLEEFTTKHINPGSWENEAARMTDGTDPHVPPRGKGWKWKPDMACREVKTIRGQTERSLISGTRIGNIPSEPVSPPESPDQILTSAFFFSYLTSGAFGPLYATFPF